MAKGSNKDWKWISMITPAIFVLRDVLRKVQTGFEIPFNSIKHASPSTAADIQDIRDYLELHKVQSCVDARPNSDRATPARDLIAEGIAYAGTSRPFKNFTSVVRKANFVAETAPRPNTEAMVTDRQDEEVVEEGPDQDADEMDSRRNTAVTMEDLSLDDEEFIDGMELMDFVSMVNDLTTSLY